MLSGVFIKLQHALSFFISELSLGSSSSAAPANIFVLVSAVALLCVFLLHRFCLGAYFERRRVFRQPLPFTHAAVTGSGAPLRCVSPSTGVMLTQSVRTFTVSDVCEAASMAREAQKEWATHSTFAHRRAVLRTLIQLILQNQQSIIDMSCAETGKTALEATMGEVMMSLEKLRWLVKHGEHYLSPEERPVPFLLRFTKRAFVQYVPIGLVGIIVPWNYPFHNALSHLSTALFTGNAALLKPSEFSSASSLFLRHLFRTALTQNGWSGELIQLVVGEAEVGREMMKYVDKLLFIGSTKVGRLIMKQAAERLTPIILELGGKDPFIVLDDADLDQAVEFALVGAFINCGQNCVSAERFFVHRSLHRAFVERVVQTLKRFRQGPTTVPTTTTATTTPASVANAVISPCTSSSSFGTSPLTNADLTFSSVVLPSPHTYDVGCMVLRDACANTSKLIEEAVQQGATLEFGGMVNMHYTDNKSEGDQDHECNRDSKDDEKKQPNHFFMPSVVTNVSEEMKIFQEEAFAPVMSVIAFDNDDEMLRKVNNCDYGLGATIFSKNLSRAQALARQIESGMVSINEFASVPLIQSLPFGGVKLSGFGHFNGVEGLRNFTRLQACVTDRWSGIRTRIPAFLRYPVNPKARLIVTTLLPVVFGTTMWQQMKAAVHALQVLVGSGCGIDIKAVPAPAVNGELPTRPNEQETGAKQKVL